MMRSPCHSHKDKRRRRVASPFKIYQSPSGKPSSAKRTKNSRPVLKSRNGRSLVSQFTKCRKSEAPAVSLHCLFYFYFSFSLIYKLFYYYWAEMHSLFNNLAEELAVEQRQNTQTIVKFLKWWTNCKSLSCPGQQNHAATWAIYRRNSTQCMHVASLSMPGQAMTWELLQCNFGSNEMTCKNRRKLVEKRPRKWWGNNGSKIWIFTKSSYQKNR